MGKTFLRLSVTARQARELGEFARHGMHSRRCHRAGQASVLALVCLVASSCGGPAIGERVEQGPAEPCTINGMLFRDTPDTDFIQCGKTKGVLTGEVAVCVKQAIAKQEPFVVQSDGPALTPVHRRPALVGARFDEGYAVRMYMSETEDVGRRTPAALIVPSPGTEDLTVKAEVGTERRCVMGALRPRTRDETWVVLDPERHWEFHAAECLEWFDAGAWRKSPWSATFDADKRPRCVSSR